MGKLPPDEEKKRLELYNQGLNDVQIGKEVYVTRYAIRSWRQTRGFPPNMKRGEKPRVPEKEHRLRLKYYNQGLNDTEIGEEVGLSKTGVAYWRGAHNLPANAESGGAHGKGGAYITKEEHQKRLNLWRLGLTDREIGKKRGVSHTAIGNWRHNNNLDDSERLNKKEQHLKGALGLEELV